MESIRLVSGDDGKLRLTDEAGAIVPATASDRLAARFVDTLLTILGSSRFRPTFGTTFPTDAATWRTVGDVHRSFASAVLSVKRQLASVDEPEADARFGSATLTGVTFGARGRVELAVELASETTVVTSLALVV